MKTSTLISLLVVLTIIAGLLLSLSNIAKQQRIASITSYAECVSAGYPVMDSYPSQCRVPSGRLFVNPDESFTPGSVATSTPISEKGCVIGGCSAQLCGEAGDDLVSNCMYRPEYACYKQHSTCERQNDGKCGWTPTPALTSCLSSVTTSAQQSQ